MTLYRNMAKNLFLFQKQAYCPILELAKARLCTDQFDPPYLEGMKPKIPEYEPLNIQIKGYDFVELEAYQKEIDRVARMLEVDINDAWAVPGVTKKIQKFKPYSTIVDQEYVLTTYERNVQVVDLPSTLAPVFIQLIQAAQPPGTEVEIHKHTEEHATIRYIPDLELKDLKTQLTVLGGPRKKDDKGR